MYALRGSRRPLPMNLQLHASACVKSPGTSGRGSLDLRKSGLDLRKRGFGPQEERLWTSGTGAWTSGRALGHLLESLLESLGLLERSWRPLGPPNKYWKRLLDGPRAPRRLVWFQHAWGSNDLPKGTQEGTQIRSQRRLILKTWFLQIVSFSRRNSLIFEVQSSLFK